MTGLGPLRTRLQRSAGRGLTKFVGREREMEAMRNAAELACAGRGQIVAAIAEAGTGKSRLFFEFKAKHQSGWMVLEAFSVSHGKASSYFPVLDVLHAYFKITSDDDHSRAKRESYRARTGLERSFEDVLPYMFALLGITDSDDPLGQIDGQIRKRRTLDAIKRILLRESAQSTAHRDLRRPALDRRADPGVSQSPGRFDCHREDSLAGELSPRVLASMGIEDLLHAVAARPAGQGLRG